MNSVEAWEKYKQEHLGSISEDLSDTYQHCFLFGIALGHVQNEINTKVIVRHNSITFEDIKDFFKE